MTEEHIWIYLLVVPIICLLLGYAVGYKYGWQRRDNKAKKDRLKQMLEEIQGKVDDISYQTESQHFSSIPFFEFNIISKKRNEEEPLTLEEQLEKALKEEEYEKAARIRNLIAKEKKGE